MVVYPLCAAPQLKMCVFCACLLCAVPLSANLCLRRCVMWFDHDAYSALGGGGGGCVSSKCIVSCSPVLLSLVSCSPVLLFPIPYYSACRNDNSTLYQFKLICTENGLRSQSWRLVKVYIKDSYIYIRLKGCPCWETKRWDMLNMLISILTGNQHFLSSNSFWIPCALLSNRFLQNKCKTTVCIW